MFKIFRPPSSWASFDLGGFNFEDQVNEIESRIQITVLYGEL